LIDHIDILKDGASPIYGTDAVAGVVNVFLIHRFRGLEVYASYGNTILVSPTIAVKKPATCSQVPGTTRQTSWFTRGFTTPSAIYSRDAEISHDADKNKYRWS